MKSGSAASIGLAIGLALSGCAAGADAPSVGSGCTPQAMLSCACLDGSPGRQVCDASGASYAACQCNAPGAGAAAGAQPGAMASEPVPSTMTGSPAGAAGGAAPVTTQQPSPSTM